MGKSAVVSAAAVGPAIDDLLDRSGTRVRVGQRQPYKTYDNTYPDLRLWRASQGPGGETRESRPLSQVWESPSGAGPGCGAAVPDRKRRDRDGQTWRRTRAGSGGLSDPAGVRARRSGAKTHNLEQEPWRDCETGRGRPWGTDG